MAADDALMVRWVQNLSHGYMQLRWARCVGELRKSASKIMVAGSVLMVRYV